MPRPEYATPSFALGMVGFGLGYHAATPVCLTRSFFFFAQGQLFAAPLPQLTCVWLGGEAMVNLHPDPQGLPIKHLYHPMVVHIHASCIKIYKETNMI